MLPKKIPNLLFRPWCPSLSSSPNLSDWRSDAPSSSYLLERGRKKRKEPKKITSQIEPGKELVQTNELEDSGQPQSKELVLGGWIGLAACGLIGNRARGRRAGRKRDCERAMRVERAGAGAFVLAEGKKGYSRKWNEEEGWMCKYICRGRTVGCICGDLYRKWTAHSFFRVNSAEFRTRQRSIFALVKEF